MFLGRFDYTLTYCPGSRNTKPDAISCQFSISEEETPEEQILSPRCVVAATGWDVERSVLAAQRSHPLPQIQPGLKCSSEAIPRSCPAIRVFRGPCPSSGVVLVGSNLLRHQGVCLRLLRLRPWQGLSLRPRRPVTTTASAPSILVPHCPGFRHRSANLPR